MSHARFIQVHALTSYPASLLNRDDVGFAKRIPFGGVERTRVSSQCLKRHWRCFDGEHAITNVVAGDGVVRASVRSRRTFEEHVARPLVVEGMAPEVVDAVVGALMVELLGESAKARRAREGEGRESKRPRKASIPVGKVDGDESPAERAPLETGQVTVLGWPEILFLRDLARSVVRAANSAEPRTVRAALDARFTREQKENLRTMRRGAGLDAALFGRMVTSDILARGDAAVHVAHAFTVHAEATESDYFAAVDDIVAQRDELGSGHIGASELTTGLYYTYVAVDVPLLVSNLEGVDRKNWATADRGLAADVVRRLVHLVATVSPGAKQGATAPHAYAHLVLAEAGNAQPRTLANAFLEPVNPRGNLATNAYTAMADHLADLDQMYGATGARRLAALGKRDLFARVAPEQGDLASVAGWVATQVRGRP